MSKKALSGLRVIEYAQNIGVPYAAKMMADLGAEVIKVEPPGTGDRARSMGPFVGEENHPEKSCVFLYVNTNKKSVTIDLDQPDGVQLFKKLVSTADVLIREGDPDYFAEKGLSYEELSAENPRLIVSSNTPFGESGPYRNYAASANVVSHMSGGTVLYPHGTGDNDKAPCMLGGNFEEYDVGGMVFIGITAALHWRNRSGRGQYIENSALEAHFMYLTTELNIYPVFGQTFNRSGETQRQQASLCFAVKDGYMCPFISQQKEFNALAKVLGKEEWLKEEWFNDVTQRRARAEDIMAVMREWGKQYTKAEASEILQRNRVPIGPVDTPADVVNSEQFSVRGFFTTVDHPGCGEMKIPGRPFLMSKTPHTYEKAAPLLGEDNDKVFGELLGVSAQELARLAGAGVI